MRWLQLCVVSDSDANGRNSGWATIRSPPLAVIADTVSLPDPTFTTSSGSRINSAMAPNDPILQAVSLSASWAAKRSVMFLGHETPALRGVELGRAGGVKPGPDDVPGAPPSVNLTPPYAPKPGRSKPIGSSYCL